MTKKIILSIILALVAFTAKAQIVYVYSNADDGFLNIRMKPSASSDIVGVLYNGKEGAKLLDKSNKYWYKVSKDGVVGYVNKRFAKLTPTMTPSNRRQEQDPANNFEKLQAGMTPEECKSICGEPDKISKQIYSNRVVEFWNYKNPKGTLHFRNVFPMKKDLKGCKKLFNTILGTGDIKDIQDILIEYHPEPIDEYLDDHTAFDVYIPYTAIDGKTCGIGIEVKYTEKEYPLKQSSREYSHVKDEKGNTCLSAAYAKATEQSGLYRPDVAHDILVSNKFRQIWRNHILGASMVLHGKSEDISRFTSITLYPQENIHFSLDVMPAYKELLADDSANTCIPLSYENLFDYMERSLNMEQKAEWLVYLKRRYLFFYFSHLFE